MANGDDYPIFLSLLIDLGFLCALICPHLSHFHKEDCWRAEYSGMGSLKKMQHSRDWRVRG